MTLAVRFFNPPSSLRGAVLIVPAMGCAQKFYSALAVWLADHGWLAVTFDFRGMGASRRGSLRGFQADIMDWARLDCAAVLNAVAQRAPGLPLTWIGHSLGGQILPFVPGKERIDKVITVAAGSGYWRENAPQLRLIVWLLWFFIVPVSLPLFGYFPGRRLRMVGDLPRGVMSQWRRWCLHAEYAAGAEGAAARASYASVQTPMVSLSFSDDEMMSARNIESLHSFYTGARPSMKRISPEEAGVTRIGHFGFFRKEFRHTLWPKYLLPELA